MFLTTPEDNIQQVHQALGNGAAVTAELHFSVGTDLGTATYFFCGVPAMWVCLKLPDFTYLRDKEGYLQK